MRSLVVRPSPKLFCYLLGITHLLPIVWVASLSGCDGPIPPNGYGAPVLEYPIADCIQDVQQIYPEAHLCLYVEGATYAVEPPNDGEPCTYGQCDIRSWQLVSRDGQSQPLAAPEYPIPMTPEERTTDSLEGILVFSSEERCAPPPFGIQDLHRCTYSVTSDSPDQGCFAAINIPLLIGEGGLYMDASKSNDISLHYSQLFGYDVQELHGNEAVEQLCSQRQPIQSEHQLIDISWELIGSGQGMVHFPRLSETPKCHKTSKQSTTCTVKVSPGTQLVAAAIPEKDDHLVAWMDNHICAEPTCEQTIAVHGKPMKLTVGFHPKKLPLTISLIQDPIITQTTSVKATHTGYHGRTIVDECSSSEQPCTYLVDYNADVVLTGVYHPNEHIGLHPDEPWLMGNLNDKGVDGCAEHTCRMTMNSPRQVTAKFSSNVYAISIFPKDGSDIAAAGGVIAQPLENAKGISPLHCSNSSPEHPCVTYVHSGTAVTLVADTTIQDASRRLLTWGLHHRDSLRGVEGCSPTVVLTEPDRCTFTVTDRDVALQPIFGHRIDIRRRGMGTIQADDPVFLAPGCEQEADDHTPCYGYAPAGEPVRLLAVAPADQAFVGWKTSSDTTLTEKISHPSRAIRSLRPTHMLKAANSGNPLTFPAVNQALALVAEFGFQLKLSLLKYDDCGGVQLQPQGAVTPTSCDTECSYTYVAGTEIELSAHPQGSPTPGIDWHLASTALSESPRCLPLLGDSENTCVVRPSSNTSIEANFHYPIRVEHRHMHDQTENVGQTDIFINDILTDGCIDRFCTINAPCGSRVALKPLLYEDEGYVLEPWEGCPDSSPDNATCTIVADQPRDVSVGFQCVYDLIVNTHNHEAKAIVLADSWNGDARECESLECRYQIPCAEGVTLTAVSSAYPGATQQWCRNSQNCITTKTVRLPPQTTPAAREYDLFYTYSLSLNRSSIPSPARVRAKPNPVLPANKSIDCTRDAATTCRGWFLAGEKIVFSVDTPDSRRAIATWSGCSEANGRVTRTACTFSYLSENVHITPKVTLSPPPSPPPSPGPIPRPCSGRSCPEDP